MLTQTQLRRRLKLRDFDTLLAVARCGSMAKAAIELSVSQPAVSKAIADMEHSVGVQLFDRTPQGIEPTIYGEIALKCARAVFDDIRQGMQEIDSVSDPTVGELRIGAAEPMLGGFLAAVIVVLHRKYPKLRFSVEQPQSVEEQHRELRERRVDLVIGRALPNRSEDDFTSEILFREPWSVVAGRGNPLTRRRKLHLADLLHEPWTVPHVGSAVWSYLIEAFQQAGLDRPRSVVTCGSIQMHSALLASGPYLAIFPRSLLRFSPYRMAVQILPVQLPGTPPPVAITMLKKRTVSPATRLFLDCARDLAKPLARI